MFSPRERDWQRREVIVDNDGASGVDYTEVGSWNEIDGGFARHDGTYRDGENPFRAGTARMTRATRNRDAMVSYQPRLTAPGKYAVYVSYKTVEGSVFYFAGSILSAQLLRLLIVHGFGHPMPGVPATLLLGLLGGFAGQIGDLSASLLKRYSGIKDYGSIFPGHGGVMDRFDSVIFVMIVMYCYTLVL